MNKADIIFVEILKYLLPLMNLIFNLLRIIVVSRFSDVKE